MDTLFHADILLEDFTVLKDAYLGVSGNKICYLGAEKPKETYTEYRDMPRHLLMPGLYNLHAHNPMVLLRGVGSDLPLHRWLTEKIFPTEAKLREFDISVGQRLAMMELLASGVVSFSDMYFYSHISVQEALKAGMKANFNTAIVAFDPDLPYEKNEDVIRALDFYDSHQHLPEDGVKIDFGIHAEYTNNADTVRQHGQQCKARGAIMHLHLSETQKEHEECKARHGKTPAQWFADLGVFDNPTIAAHCVALEAEDIQIFKEKNIWAIHNPTSNMKLASGFLPLEEMLKADVNLVLGTDGAASNNNLNFFEEMHLAAVIHKGYSGDPTLLSPQKVLQMATISGAKAQGRAESGALKVGNFADIVAIDLDKPHLMPNHDTVALLVYSVQGSDVALTMINGKVLYEKGEFLTIDAEKVRFDLAESMKHMFA